MQQSEARLPEHTSASQLSCYAACPRRYYYRYLAKLEPETKGEGLVLGSAVHSTLAWWFDERRIGRTPSGTERLAVLRADLHASLGEGCDAQVERLSAEAERLVDAFIARCGDLAVTHSEAPIAISLIDPETGEVMPRQLIGYLDFCLAGGNVVELKTARTAYSRMAIVTNLQFGAYCAALDFAGGGGSLNLVALIRTKTARVQVETITPSSDRTRWFMSVACALERGIAAGIYPPAPSVMNCASCEFKGHCLGLNGPADDNESAEVA